MRATETHILVPATGLSVWSGIAIVFLGVVVLVSSIIQHMTLIRELRSGTWSAGRIARNAVILATLLAIVGVGMSAYLLISSLAPQAAVHASGAAFVSPGPSTYPRAIRLRPDP